MQEWGSSGKLWHPIRVFLKVRDEWFESQTAVEIGSYAGKFVWFLLRWRVGDLRCWSGIWPVPLDAAIRAKHFLQDIVQFGDILVVVLIAGERSASMRMGLNDQRDDHSRHCSHL
jgi:hypothetical protein